MKILAWIVSAPLVMALAAGAATRSAGPFLVMLLFPVLGPFVGLTSSAPYFTLQFKLSLGAGLLFSLGLMVVGARSFDLQPWGRLALLFGGLTWTVCAGLGLGPQ